MKYEQGIKELVKAKDTLGQASVDLYAFINFMMKSQVLKTKQILESQITGKNSIILKINLIYVFSNHFFLENMLKGEDAFRNIWQIQVKPITIQKDLTEDPILGKCAKTLLKKDDQVVEANYNQFIVKSS